MPAQHRPPVTGHSGWTVVSQVTDQIINTNAGQSVVGTYVYFVTGEGNEGSVFIPDVHYSAATVKAAIDAKATVLDEVGRLANAVAGSL